MYGEVWGDMGRYGDLDSHTERRCYREMWGDMGRYEEIWGSKQPTTKSAAMPTDARFSRRSSSPSYC